MILYGNTLRPALSSPVLRTGPIVPGVSLGSGGSAGTPVTNLPISAPYTVNGSNPVGSANPPAGTPISGTTPPANGTAGNPPLTTILPYNFGQGDGEDDYSNAGVPGAADVEALQPTPATTTSSGPSVALIVILAIAAIGGGAWWYFKHKKQAKGGMSDVN